MTTEMKLKVHKARLEDNNLVEGVEIASGDRLTVIPTDEFAKWKLKKKDWSGYDVYVEIV